MEQQDSPKKAIIALVVIVLLVIAATVVIVMTNNKPTNDSTTSNIPTTSPTVSSDTQSISSSVKLKDGTYSATGSYQTPGGRESIGVKVTIADGTITDTSVTEMGKTGEAQEFQAAFASGYKSQVVGKKVSEVNLTRVAGSSLTPNGFNNAISQIESQAAA